MTRARPTRGAKASVTFRIHYYTRWGENLFLECLTPARGKGAAERQVHPMQHVGDGFWSLRLDRLEPGSLLEYRYEFRDGRGDGRREPALRRLEITGGKQAVWDHWLACELPDGAFLRQAFAGIIFNPSREAVRMPSPQKRRLRVTIRAPRVMAWQRLCISGGHPLLGDWKSARARVMSSEHYPLWELDLPAEEFPGPIEFKFGLWDERVERLVQFEAGPNRWFHGVPPKCDVLVVNYEQYWHCQPWRGAGVAIPVFSLRSERGYGIGEFADLAPFAEWASGCGLHLVQLLPVNDTSSEFTWRDSYPYKAISTAALHPIYLNIEQVFRDCDVPLPNGYAKRRAALNRLSQVDYEKVLKDKLAYLRRLYSRLGKTATSGRSFKHYLREQAHWLVPYAAFCRLRDLHGTADFTQWDEHATYQQRRIRTWLKAGKPEYDEVMFHCWVQYHLDRQLSEALAAGHGHGVAFKGDLPIGIDRSSVEAWTEPELFRMDRQTGAPPDAFAELGQNWGFPTYHWPRMEADGYAWWRRRFRRMSAAFDAMRIDHILGFFRIWEIPQQYREGIMGHFNPTLPLCQEEIQQAGFARDPKRFGVGAVAEAMLPQFFGGSAKKVKRQLLAQDDEGFFRLRPEFTAAEARQAWYARVCTEREAKAIEEGVTRLGLEVLFLEDPDQPGRFHPRINLTHTALFKALPDDEQAALHRLHDDFYHRRHTRFWANEAMKKLPMLMDASSMLICGEDLGMVPDSVPVVLRRLGLLSLEVQRWPKRLGHRFSEPKDYPYLSVCTTSTHDMSTIRGWWEEEAEMRQSFWTEVMGCDGAAPCDCSTSICRFIIEQNLASPSMWCILPLQDWLGVDSQLRHPVAAKERINVPAIPRHYWRYRMHMTIEALLAAKEFNRSVAELVEASGRGRRIC
ncbi:MAG: 4-alpha-glucanotransferase [Sedimentisphaerales bacterium]|nr:4-alpha-glucanotransferase [Sedimentisphaerales bacterium]